MNHEIRALLGGRRPLLVMFDLDGTLVDSARDLAQAVDDMLATLGLPAAGEQNIRGWIGNGAATLVRRALAGSDDEARVAAIDDALHERALDVFREAYTRANGQSACLYPGVSERLDQWRAQGMRMAVVTNKPRPFAMPLLVSMGLGDVFDMVVGGECLPHKKPHPLPLLHVAETLGVAPGDCLMVGDSRHDVAAARAAGIPVICRRDGYNHGEDIALANPDWLFSHFDELG